MHNTGKNDNNKQGELDKRELLGTNGKKEWWVAVGVEEDVCGVCVWRVRVACV